MSLRLRNIDTIVTGQAQSKEPERDCDASITSSGTATPPYDHPKDVPEGLQRNHLGFAFEEDLFASRVYRKPLFSKSGDSLITSAARTTAWSILSGISLTDVSKISILSVPIYAYEISNSARYVFGDFQPEKVTTEPREAASNAVQQPSKVERRSGFALFFRSGTKAARLKTPRQQEPRVLGVSLHDLIKYSNIPISLTNEKGESYIYGYIPVFVCKTGVYLKENGQSISSYRVYTSTLTLYTQPRLSKTYSVSVGPLVAFKKLRSPLIIRQNTAEVSTGLATRFTTQHASY